MSVSKNIPISFFITIAIVIVIEATLSQHDQTAAFHADTLLEDRFYPPNRIPAFEESIIQWQIYHALAGQEPVDILLVGDSSCLMGLRPKLIEQRTGLSCWDIGTLDYLGAKGYTDTLDLFIRNRGVPKVVVYHIVCISLNFSDQGVKRFGYLERLQTWVDKYLRDEKTKSPALSLPSMQYRRKAQRYLTTFSGEEKQEWLEQKRGPYPSDNEVRELIRTRKGSLVEIRYDDLNKIERLKPFVHPDAQRELLKTIEICRKHSCILLLSINPIPLNAKTDENLQNLTFFESKMRNLTSDSSHVQMMKPFIRFYPVQLCASYNHLTDAGARYNSEEVSKSIIEILDIKDKHVPDLPDFQKEYTIAGLLFPNSDFEKGTMEGWKFIGSAFLNQPTKGDNVAVRSQSAERVHQQGDYWIGTYERYQGEDYQTPGDTQGDKPTGSLVSQPFIIDHDRISFLIGGGNKPETQYVALQVNDREVRKANAGFIDPMRLYSWDVSELIGQEAQIIVKDLDSDYFGHINVDYFHYQKPQNKLPAPKTNR